MAETRASARVPAHPEASLCTIPYGRVSADISPSWQKPERQLGCRLICKPPCAPSLTVGFLPIYRRHGGNPSVSQGAGSPGSLPVHHPLRSGFCRYIAVVAETRASARVPAHLQASLCTIPYGRVSADISPSWRKPERQPGCRLTRKPPCAPSLTVGFLPIYRRRGRNPSVSQGAGSSASLPVHPPLRSGFCRYI